MTTGRHITVGGRALKNSGGMTELLLRLLVVAMALALLAAAAARAQSVFSAEQLRDAVVRYAAAQAGEDAEITVLAPVSAEKFGEDGVTARCSGESFRGQCSAALEFLLNGRVIRRASVPLYVKIYRSVPVAAAQLMTGIALTDDNVFFRKQDASAYSDADFPSPEELRGATLRRPAGKGAVITRTMLLAAGGVRKGESVSLRVVAGAVVLTAPGTALNDASPGEPVRVSRAGSTAVFSGTLADDSAVEIVMKK